MKKEIKVVVFESDSCIYDFPDKPEDFIVWWKNKFDLIPKEFKEKAYINCNTSSYYTSTVLEVEIYYCRLETDDEETERLKETEKFQRHKKEKELLELKRLKDKYEKQ